MQNDKKSVLKREGNESVGVEETLVVKCTLR